MAKLIIGLGTGRCGTTSLSVFLNAQEKTKVLHEGHDGKDYHLLPWYNAETLVLLWLDSLTQSNTANDYYGDVMLYFLPYVEFIMSKFSNAVFICLQRNRAEVIDSYMNWTGESVNHWSYHDGRTWQYDDWDACFPKFDEPDKAKAIGLYWDSYYAEVERLIKIYPNKIACFPTEYLNSIEGQNVILDFIGYTGKRQTGIACHANKRCSKGLFRSLMLKVMILSRLILPKQVRHFLWHNFSIEKWFQ